MADKNARDAATVSASTSSPGMGKQALGGEHEGDRLTVAAPAGPASTACSDAATVDEPGHVAVPVKPPDVSMDVGLFSADRVPAGIRNLEHFVPSIPPRAQKKARPTSEAQMDIDDRPTDRTRTPGQRHGKPIDCRAGEEAQS